MNKSKKNEVPDEAMIAAIEALLAPSVKLEFIYILKSVFQLLNKPYLHGSWRWKAFFDRKWLKAKDD